MLTDVDDSQPGGAADWLAWQLGHTISNGDGRWLWAVLMGYQHDQGGLGDASTPAAALDGLRLAASLREVIDEATGALVRESREMNVSWAQIGVAAGVSKQTAYSRWNRPAHPRTEEDAPCER